MRNLLLAAALLAGPLLSSARAELPPSVYEEAKKAAPEVLEIEVTRVALNQKEENGMRRTSVFANATISEIERSKAGLQPGDKISVRYLTLTALEPGWVGPGQNLPLEKGKKYRAYLKKAGSHFYIAALGRSFEEVK